MFHLRLTHGAGHSCAYCSVTKEEPDAYLEDEAAAMECVASGFFELIGTTGQEPLVTEPPEPELEGMTVKELMAYAETTGVDLEGATKKADIIAKIETAEADAIKE